VPKNRTSPTVAFPDGEPFVCVAIQNTGVKKRDVLKIAIVGQKLIKNISFTLCAVELMFACTFDKCQGKTLMYVIISLHNNPWKMAELGHIYTALSRVTEGKFLRVWPAANLYGDLDRLRKFEFSPSIVALDYAYDEEGIFKVDRYIQKWNEVNSASAQPVRPVDRIMTRPPPQPITFANHSRWYVPFLRLAFQQPIDNNPEWNRAINEIQTHWNNDRPFEMAVNELIAMYRMMLPHYGHLKAYIANLPAGYIPQEFQEFLLNDFRLWDEAQTTQKMDALNPDVKIAFWQLHDLLGEGQDRIQAFYDTINTISIDLQSAITLHINSLNVAANAAYESDLAALRLANHEANEHYNAIHNTNIFDETTSASRGRGRRGGGRSGARNGPRGRSSTGGRTGADRGRGVGGGGGRNRDEGQVVSGVNVHTISARGGGRDTVSSGRRGRTSS
jgi:hypothetical protein